MPVTVEATALVVAGPETFQGSDGATISKWEVILDSGAKLLTYSQKCFDVVNANLNKPLTFLCELNSRNPDMPPKVVVVRDETGDLYDYNAAKAGAARAGGGGGQSGFRAGRAQAAYRNTAEGAADERASIHRSVALQQAVLVLGQNADGSQDVIALAEDFFDWLQGGGEDEPE